MPDKSKPAGGTQRRLEKEIYRLIKGLVELDSPNTGFAVNVLFNNGTYYYNKANVPLSFGTFLTSLVEFLEGHDCLSVCPDEMAEAENAACQGVTGACIPGRKTCPAGQEACFPVFFDCFSCPTKTT